MKPVLIVLLEQKDTSKDQPRERCITGLGGPMGEAPVVPRVAVPSRYIRVRQHTEFCLTVRVQGSDPVSLRR